MKTRERSKESRVLEAVAGRFDRWREKRSWGERIPEALWKAATDLAGRVPISRVSRELRLDYYELKERVDGRSRSKSIQTTAPFVELKADQAIEVKQESCAVVEMETEGGRKVKIAIQQAEVATILEWASRLWGSLRS